MKVLSIIKVFILFICSCSGSNESYERKSLSMINEYLDEENKNKFFRVSEQVEVLGRRKNHISMLEIIEFLDNHKPIFFSVNETNQYLSSLDSLIKIHRLDILSYEDVFNNLKLLTSDVEKHEFNKLLIESNILILEGEILDAMYDKVFDGHTKRYVINSNFDKENYEVGDTARVILVMSQELFTNFKFNFQDITMEYSEGITLVKKEKIGECLYVSFFIESEPKGFIFAGFEFEDMESGKVFKTNARFSLIPAVHNL